MNINEKIKSLRKLMEAKGIDAYVIPSFDPHQSEYIADFYKSREWISGFTGSAGLALVTMDKAKLWTDGRYFIQAEKELADSEFELMKMATPGYPTYTEWLRDNIADDGVVGFDGKVFPQSDVKNLEKVLARTNIKLSHEYDFIKEIWTDRPDEPMSQAIVHDIKYTGLTTKEKLEEVRELLKENNSTHTLIASLDDIAWVYNIRGRDVESSPVIISYALISLDKAYLFVNEEKIDQEVRKHLEDSGVTIKGYEEVFEYTKRIDKDSKVYLNEQMINNSLYSLIPSECEIINGTNLTTILKGKKNPTEIESQKNAYIKDGVALVNFMHWLDKNIDKEEITEVSAAEKLEDFRKEQEGFVEPSFSTIAGYKENAAMMHYKAELGKSNSKLEKEGMFLVDSGGQYYDGTTDITRTIILGEISDEERKDYTLTLKGHINLISARFLEGTTGYQLDMLSRYPLWQEGLDYKCGTGHGVGFFLNVHEGPHRIANSPNNVALEEGMVVTVEPGVYKAGKHGVRIENVVAVKKDIDTGDYGGQFYSFDMLSYCPIDLGGIDKDMLNLNEIEWLNNYHEDVYEKLSPHLDKEVEEWLKNATRSI